MISLPCGMTMPFQPDELTRLVVQALEELGVPYMMVGSLSVNFYAIPRSTQGADFVIQMEALTLSRLAGRLAPALKLSPQSAFETVTWTTKHLFDSTDGDIPFKIEVFELSEDAHDRERFARRRRVPFADIATWLPTVEDVIVTKLRRSRSGRRVKDIEDVRNILAVQGDALDWAYVHRWCVAHDTRGLLDRVRAALP